MATCSHNWKLQRRRCRVVYALAERIARVAVVFVVDSDISWLPPLPHILGHRNDTHPQCTIVAIAKASNGLCERICKTLDTQQDKAWSVDQLAMFDLAIESAVSEFASWRVLHHVTECKRETCDTRVK